MDGQFPHSQLEEESMVMGEEGKSEFGSGNNLSISNIFTQEFLDHSKGNFLTCYFRVKAYRELN